MKRSVVLVVMLLMFAAALPRVGATQIEDICARCFFDDAATALLLKDGVESTSLVDPEHDQPPDRILELHKSVGEDIPVPGILFQIYKVASLDQPEVEDIPLTDTPSREDVRRYCVPEALVATLTTDPEGFAAFNFTKNGCPDGIYMVVEHPDVSGEAAEPFFFRIPGFSGESSEELYTVTVRSKRAVESVPDISVDILEPDKGEMSFDVFQPHLRILRVGIPVGLDHARKFTVSDTFPPQLTYIWGSPVVKLYTKSGEERQLLWNTHFYLSEGTLFGDGEPKDRFVISLTQKGMSFVMSSLGEGSSIAELRVYYEAYIDEDAVPGAYISSRAEVDYVDRHGRGFRAEANSSGVCTGGIQLCRTDMDGAPLAGIRFQIARSATEAELSDPEVEVEELTVDGQALDMIFVSFVPGEDLTIPRASTVTTDENGEAVFFGLAHGTYYIVETGGSADYERHTKPLQVLIDDMSHRSDEDRKRGILVADAEQILPQTENAAAFPFTLAGLGIACGALLMLLVNYRRGTL